MTYGILAIFIAFAVSHFAKKGISPGPGPDPPEPFLPDGIQKAQVFTKNFYVPLCQLSMQYDGVRNRTIYYDIDYTLSQYEKKMYLNNYRYPGDCLAMPNNIPTPVLYDEFIQKTDSASEYFYAIENLMSQSAILTQFEANDFEEIFPFLPLGIQSAQILVTNLCNNGSGTGFNGYVSPTRLISISYTQGTYNDDSFSEDACNDISVFNVNAPIIYNTFYETAGTVNQYLYAKQNFTTLNNLLAEFNATGFVPN